MKLLFIIDSLGSGGAQRQMVTLAAGLVYRGHRVEIFTYYDEDHFAGLAQAAGVVVHVHVKPSRYSMQPLQKLRKLMRDGGFDCALAFLETPALYAEIARIGRAVPRLVVSERFCYSPSTLGARGQLKQQMHRLANWITVNSHHQRSMMVNMFPWMEGKICTIWNGCDTQHFRATPLPDRVEGVLRVQVLASLAMKKNPMGLARAVVLCRERYGLRVEVNWAGVPTVSVEGDQAKTVTDSILKSANALSQWHWAGEIKDVRPLFANCDVAVHPSFAEGLPNAICEALSSGRPVLASDFGDHDRLLNGGANGALFDPGRPESIVESLGAYARLNAGERARMAQAARTFAEQELSTGRFVQAYEDLFSRLTCVDVT